MFRAVRCGWPGGARHTGLTGLDVTGGACGLIGCNAMNLTNIRYLVSPVVLDDGCLEASIADGLSCVRSTWMRLALWLPRVSTRMHSCSSSGSSGRVLGLVTGPALGYRRYVGAVYRLTPRLWSPYCFSDGSVFGAGMRCKRATATFGLISRCVFHAVVVCANCHLSVQP